MSLKDSIRNKLRNVAGVGMLERRIGELESQIKSHAKPDLVRQLEARALSSSAAFIESHMQKATALNSNLEVIDYALGRVSKEVLFCEFGVFQGGTINHIARQIKSKIYGFDSFKGLPENWRDGFPAGTFELTSQNLPKCESNVELIVGWFNETLPPFVSQHHEPISLLHVDCDLYSSTKTIFENLGKQLIPGSVIVFDEYFNYPGWQEHEHRAFIEYVEKTGHRFEYICYNRYHEQVAVQLM